jgi:crotonobetainyl-CoA:carnitine CoA-transferase CaiB-like acyl-CoA transferase
MKLEGVKVIDLSWFLPGPLLAMALADHGAEVVKVEPPGEGDPGRQIGPMDARTSAFFRNLNRGKKSVVIDLKTAASREALLRLCEAADVVVESFRPGVAKRLGID